MSATMQPESSQWPRTVPTPASTAGESVKIKTADLIGPALDWAVAKAEGMDALQIKRNGPVHLWRTFGADPATYAPSTNWGQGGPIIERNHIAVFSVEAGPFKGEWAAEKHCRQQALEFDGEGGVGYAFYESHVVKGPTPLIAAMRCFVALMLGDEVDVPDELIDAA